MSAQPEALQLADILQHKLPSVECLEKAAAELRRLHSVNAELLEALRGMVALEEGNLRGGDDDDISIELRCARAAIARAEGVQPPRIEGYNTNRDQPTVTIKGVKP